MNILKESDFRKEIKTAPRAAYLFFGDEDYLKLSAVRLAREALCPDPSFSVFNEMRLDATDFTADGGAHGADGDVLGKVVVGADADADDGGSQADCALRVGLHLDEAE